MSFGLTLLADLMLVTAALGKASVGYTSSDFAGCVRAVSAPPGCALWPLGPLDIRCAP